MYTADLTDLVEGHGVQPNMYADDTQISGHCHSNSTDRLQLTLSACLDDVSAWMCANRLQLNTSKTEVLWCTTSRGQHQLLVTAIQIGTDYVTPSTTVRDLGIYIDVNISMKTQVTGTVADCFATQRQL